MERYKFDNADFEELYFALTNFEKGYKVKFKEGEFEKTKSFEDFTEKIIEKFDFVEMQDCTSQQMFYRLRKAIKEVCPEISDITLDTELKTIFPLKNRKQRIAELREKLGIKMSILKAQDYEFYPLLIGTIFSLVYLFYDFSVGFLLLILFVSLIELAMRGDNAFTKDTIRDLVNHLMQYHYFDCRKDPNTINKEEFRKVILDYFAKKCVLIKNN